MEKELIAIPGTNHVSQRLRLSVERIGWSQATGLGVTRVAAMELVISARGRRCL